MNGLSVIIPSRTASNVVASATAARELDKVNIIIVNDGITPANRDEFAEWDRRVEPHWRSGEKPFIFSRNVNIGIRAAKDDDVILLNDDAILKTHWGFRAMQQMADEHQEFGVISAVTNVASNPLQLANRSYHPGALVDSATSVAFVCVLIPRRTIEAVGPLDERFTAYGWEDNDYCRRVREAGMKVGIFTGCYVDHGSLRSTFRGDPRATAQIEEGAQIYMAKWGDLA